MCREKLYKPSVFEISGLLRFKTLSSTKLKLNSSIPSQDQDDKYKNLEFQVQKSLRYQTE